MHDDEFQHLALKALSGDISPEENAALERGLKEEPARQAELEDLRAALAITRATLPLASALEASPVELPAHRLNQLRSSVRLHFQKEEAKPEAATRFAGWNWLRTAWGQSLSGAALAVLCVVLIVASQSGPSGIEIGLYAESTTRDGVTALTLPESASVRVTRFENDQAFDQWLSRPFDREEKARIWFDDEHDLIHVRLRPTLFRESREWTRPLPAGDADRRAALESLLRSL
ncbi:MAG: hypothetical protein B9S32_02965 [Verrucomicrobia bacterium Tous-C9LFEB]|nr:MAG: hypothetical protein B9S32_02965 [Verrucomicrobia bacterium Tous-C9LFEB]